MNLASAFITFLSSASQACGIVLGVSLPWSKVQFQFISAAACLVAGQLRTNVSHLSSFSFALHNICMQCWNLRCKPWLSILLRYLPSSLLLHLDRLLIAALRRKWTSATTTLAKAWVLFLKCQSFIICYDMPLACAAFITLIRSNIKNACLRELLSTLDYIYIG